MELSFSAAVDLVVAHPISGEKGVYMGPFPHDAPPPTISAQNPMGTDGFAFVEFAHPEPVELHRLFRRMGFAEVARHRRKAITVYRQGDVDYLVNEEPNTHAARFAALHGPCGASMGFRVVDAAQAYQRAVSLGAEPADAEQGSQALELVAVFSI
jgi:4-hydroxyphenylpyruvate dioxygenase